MWKKVRKSNVAGRVSPYLRETESKGERGGGGGGESMAGR